MTTQIIKNCNVCNSSDLKEVISLGYLPHPNVMQSVGSKLEEANFIPHDLLKCNNCSLVQLGCIVDQKIVFPLDYAYVSRTTKILRDNFTQLAENVCKIINLHTNDLVVDIGSNDGTSLSNYKNKCRILGIEPTNAAIYANENGVPTEQVFFNLETAKDIVSKHGKAKVILISNCFAHMADINSVMFGINELLEDDGIFISENHYLIDLLRTLQYDTIYSEHIRFYTVNSLKYLLNMYNLEIFDVKNIPTHGGSIRVLASKKEKYKINDSVSKCLKQENEYLTNDTFNYFKWGVHKSKIDLYKILSNSGRIAAIGAPSRSVTLVNFVHLDENIIKFILESPGSPKVNKYLSGTRIPILEETPDLLQQVDSLLLLSWHIADEIMPKLRNKGFKGKFIIPLPEVEIK